MGKKRQKKGEEQQRQNPNIAEATRIRISQVLQHFRVKKDDGKALKSIRYIFFVCAFTVYTTVILLL